MSIEHMPLSIWAQEAFGRPIHRQDYLAGREGKNMVYINPRLLIGVILEVKRSNGEWKEAVVVDLSVAGSGWMPEVTEHDYFQVKFTGGETKKILMQQDLQLLIRPVHDLVGLVESQVRHLADRRRKRSEDIEEFSSEGFAATQESQSIEVPLSPTLQMPPPKAKKPRPTSSTAPPVSFSDDDDIFDDAALLAATAEAEKRLKQRGMCD